MRTDYDAIAGAYRRAKEQSWRDTIEGHTFLRALGDVSGLAVLDLACGEGHYSRLARDRGASRVVGVDVSRGMIDLARSRETQGDPKAIAYRVADAREPEFDGEFDVVTAAYLLNYAATPRDLESMAAAIARSLKPGGRFVAINANPSMDFARGPSYRKYGFDLVGPRHRPPSAGEPYAWIFHLPEGPVEVENYWLPAALYESVLHAAGFEDLRWDRPQLAPGQDAQAAEFYRDFLESPPIVTLACRRGTSAGD